MISEGESINIYRLIPDSDSYECVYARPEDRDLLYFSKGQSLLADWQPVPLLPDERLLDNSMNGEHPRRGNFPSLYRPTPVFDHRAWSVLSTLIERSVEALPVIHPSGEILLAVNVLDVVDCLDLANSRLTRNNATGRVSSIQVYQFNMRMLSGRHIFKLPETKGLEVLVSDGFKQLVQASNLNGVIFHQVA